jgi:predicted secreted hydrolase
MGDQAPDEVTLKLEVGGFGLTIDSLSHQFTVSSNDGSGLKLQLSLEPTPPPMLHNGAGWIGGPNGWTYYYSWPRMKATGSLLRGGRVAALTGAAWMDHQWGDFFVLGKPAGWQWFALQMDDGSSLMLQEFRDINGKPVEAFGTLMEPQTGGGEDIQRVLQPGEYSIEVLDRWRSPATGGEYPSRWHIRVPVSRLDIEVVPVVAGQEITSGVPPAAIYWEGKARVTGTKSGQPVSGDAYVELTGYVEPPPIDWRR